MWGEPNRPARYRRLLARLRGREDDEQREVVLDLVNLCGTSGATKTTSPGWTGRCSPSTSNFARPATTYVVDLVLGVRLLRVIHPGGELVDAQAERRDAQKLT